MQSSVEHNTHRLFFVSSGQSPQSLTSFIRQRECNAVAAFFVHLPTDFGEVLTLHIHFVFWQNNQDLQVTDSLISSPFSQLNLGNVGLWRKRQTADVDNLASRTITNQSTAVGDVLKTSILFNDAKFFINNPSNTDPLT